MRRPTHIALGLFLLALAARSAGPLQASIAEENGVPVLVINGQRRVPQLIYHTLLTRWRSFPNVMGKGVDPSAELIKLAEAHGFHLTTVVMPVVWPKDGEPANYAELDRIMGRHIELDPQVLTIPRLIGQPPKWWLDKYLSEREKFRVAPGRGEMPERRRKSVQKYVTPTSQQWQKDYYHALRMQVRHLEAKYGEHILGYHPGCQSAGENFFPLAWDRVTPVMVGFSEPFRQGFIAYAKGRYGTIDEANKAWGKRFDSFAAIQVPTMQERVAGDLGTFRDPVKQRFVIDFMTYFQRPLTDVVIESSRIVKEETGGRKLTLAFFPSPQSGHYPLGASQGGGLGLRRVLASPHLDIVCNPYGYVDRQYGGIGLIGNMRDSVGANGKMYFVEDDTRTHLAPFNHFGKTKNMTETKAVYTRLFAQTLQRGIGRWWFDFGSGYMAQPELFDLFESMRKIRKTFPLVPFRPEVAVVFDDESPLYMRCSNEVSIHSSKMSHDFGKMGTPFARYLLSDVCAGKLPSETKVVFFMNAYKIDARQRQALHKILAASGMTAVWFYAPGYVDGEKAEAANIQRLTGIAVERIAEPLPARFTLSQALPGVPIGHEFGVKESLPTMFAVAKEQPGIRQLATYLSSDRIGMAAKEMDGWRSVLFCGVRFGPEMFRALTKESNAHIYCDTNDSISGSSGYIAVSALTTGEKTLRFRRKVDLTDIFTGHRVASGIDRYTVTMGKGETRILLMK